MVLDLKRTGTVGGQTEFDLHFCPDREGTGGRRHQAAFADSVWVVYDLEDGEPALVGLVGIILYEEAHGPCLITSVLAGRAGPVMRDERTWAQVIHAAARVLRPPTGVSSMKLHRDLRVTQKTAWHLAHRIREMLRRNGIDPFDGPVEADETYIGGKVKNMHEWQRRKRGGARGSAGKVGVVGMRDQKTKKVRAAVITTPRPPLRSSSAHT